MEAAVDPPSARLVRRIEELLGTDVERPWCVHRLYEALYSAESPKEREDSLYATHLAADELADAGRAQREIISAVSIGIHCQDTLFWSIDAPQHELADFGPAFESPTILRRLGSHFVCQGL